MRIEKDMSEGKHHISSYYSLGVVLTVLLVLTFITVIFAEMDFGKLSIGVALLVASIKGAIVLIYFMHLKYENLFFKLMVAGVFVVYALVIVFTFFDYTFR